MKIQEHKDAKKQHILDSAAKVFAVKGYPPFRFGLSK
jgi:hypothetical protein